jgi:hypothetical protein
MKKNQEFFHGAYSLKKLQALEKSMSEKSNLKKVKQNFEFIFFS